MGLNIKKILSMSGAIAASVATGGATAPILIPAALNLASELIPEKDAEKIAAKAELDTWERINIVKWVETYKRLMGRSMGNFEQVYRGWLESEFIMNYADDPKEEWVDSVHEMVSKAVRWQIATSADITIEDGEVIEEG